MFIEQAILKRIALQRSAMFPTMNCEIRYIPLLWSGENPLELAFYKHYVPTGRRSSSEKPCTEYKKLTV
jgi:hypothetical protein